MMVIHKSHATHYVQPTTDTSSSSFSPFLLSPSSASPVPFYSRNCLDGLKLAETTC
jgi:hypothetical protein